MENAKSFLLCGFLWRDMARIAYRNRWSPRPDSPMDTIPPAQPTVRWWIEPKDFQATWRRQSCQGTGCYKILIFHAHQIYPWFLDVSKSIPPASIPNHFNQGPHRTVWASSTRAQPAMKVCSLRSNRTLALVAIGSESLSYSNCHSWHGWDACLDEPRCWFMAMG